ncbi:MAG: hypothetical protein JO086_00085 [Acidimicrobiia bacterium]|nr:hypothetical protein [Acidimicrobiia bacterium]
MQVPTPGRIVLYTLDSLDAAVVNRRRTSPASIAARMSSGHWPEGAQAHIGRLAGEGQILPMLIVAVGDTGDVPEWISGRVFLEGTDVLWKPTLDLAAFEPTPGRWHWPARS